MNVYLKKFLQRGLMFGGFGPIIAAVIYFAISQSTPSFSIGGVGMLLAVVSTYVVAFLVAGASVFNQIEHWSLARSLLCHFSLYYIAYVTCYLVNAWIPFSWNALLIFTGVFVGGYALVWIIVYLCMRHTGKKLNEKL